MKLSMAELGLDAASSVGKVGGSPKYGRKTKSSYTAKILDALKSEMDMDLARHTINEAKLAKLHSILNVLRDAEDTSSDHAVDALEPKRPDFLSVFDTGNTADTNAKTLPSSHRKRKKRNRLSKAVLRVLHEDSADLSSDSGDNLDDDAPENTLNKKSMAWLQSRKLEPRGPDGRPRSDSFQTIPKLRASLNAGKINKVSNYAFDDHSPKKRSPLRDIGAQGHVTSTGVPRRGYNTSTRDDDTQFHYKVMDTRSQVEEDSPSQPDAKYASPVCKYYSVPVEISVHRISVKDVDEPPELEIGRALSFNVAAMRKEGRVLASEQQNKTERDKPRSRSLGDVDLLGSDDEVLLVRAPVTSRSPAGFYRRSTVISPGGAMEMTSLDFTSRGVGNGSSEPSGMMQRMSCFVGGAEPEDKDDDVTGIWVRRNESIPKSKSLDDLLESEPKKSK